MAPPRARPGRVRLPRRTGTRAVLPARQVLLSLAALGLTLAACSTPSAGPPATSSSSPSPSRSGRTTPTPSTPGGSTPASSTSASPSSGATPTQASCADLAGRLSIEEQVGQLLMVAVSSTELTSSRASLIKRTHAGSVLLLGNSTAGLAATQEVVSAVRDAADRPQRVNVIVAADQEGGLVQRLSGNGFSDIPSAVLQAELSNASLASDAETWGDQLDKAGINLNLAPVADVVPRDLVTVNEPIGRLRRGYGSSPSTVADKVAAFTNGMNDAGIATAVKHFPGLGRVRGNTDTEARVVDSTTTRKDPYLAGFRAAVKAGVDMVMVSSATYSKIDAKRQAVFSPTVIDGMIRGDLGFDGVVISDDLAAAGVSSVSGSQRAVRFVEAGGDLAIVADPKLATAMAAALVDKAEADPAFAARVQESAGRVLAMKARRGLAEC